MRQRRRRLQRSKRSGWLPPQHDAHTEKLISTPAPTLAASAPSPHGFLPRTPQADQPGRTARPRPARPYPVRTLALHSSTTTQRQRWLIPTRQAASARSLAPEEVAEARGASGLLLHARGGLVRDEVAQVLAVRAGVVVVVAHAVLLVALTELRSARKSVVLSARGPRLLRCGRVDSERDAMGGRRL